MYERAVAAGTQTTAQPREFLLEWIADAALHYGYRLICGTSLVPVVALLGSCCWRDVPVVVRHKS